MVFFEEPSFVDALAASRERGGLLVVDVVDSSIPEHISAMDVVKWTHAIVCDWLVSHGAASVRVDVERDNDTAAIIGRGARTVILFRDGIELDRASRLLSGGALVAWLDAVLRGESTIDQLARATRDKPTDIVSRIELARALVFRGRHDNAAEEYAWLWQNMVEHDASMVGVRGSYIVAEIHSLLTKHPASRPPYEQLRDALDVETITSVTPETLADWIMLAVALDDVERVLDWFRRNVVELRGEAELERVVEFHLVPALIERGQWADAALLYNTQRWLERAERNHELRKRQSAETRAIIEESVREEASRMVVSLVAASRLDEARTALQTIRRLLGGDAMDASLAKAAQRAGVVLP